MHHRARAIVGDNLYDKVLISRVRSRRAGRPDEIAQSIVFLCSDQASLESYISGTTLTRSELDCPADQSCSWVFEAQWPGTTIPSMLFRTECPHGATTDAIGTGQELTRPSLPGAEQSRSSILPDAVQA